MFKQMDENGQYNIDCRLSSERDMDENVSAIIQFATDLRKEQVGDDKIRNRHEGYGLMADRFQEVATKMKGVNDGMKQLLQMLPMGDSAAIDKTESIANALEDLIAEAVQMAAEAKRVSGDLFDQNWSGPEETPLEQLEDNGFEDPEKEEENGDAD